MLLFITGDGGDGKHLETTGEKRHVTFNTTASAFQLRCVTFVLMINEAEEVGVTKRNLRITNEHTLTHEAAVLVPRETKRENYFSL